jgi:hypothetical protein
MKTTQFVTFEINHDEDSTIRYLRHEPEVKQSFCYLTHVPDKDSTVCFLRHKPEKRQSSCYLRPKLDGISVFCYLRRTPEKRQSSCYLRHKPDGDEVYFCYHTANEANNSVILHIQQIRTMQ